MDSRLRGATPFLIRMADQIIKKIFETKGQIEMKKMIQFAKFKYLDMKEWIQLRKRGEKPFKEYGLTLFTGKQGSGKTMSMVYVAEQYRSKYPSIYICSNFGYVYEDEPLKTLADIPNVVLKAKEDERCGVLILWDEIQNDFDSFSKVNKDVLRVVTQQRKQSIKILGTSQVFTRVSKALREQTYDVALCRTFMGRHTRAKFYDAEDFIHNIEKPEEKREMFPKKRISFIQSDDLRLLYDSYAVIQTLNEQAKEEKKNPVPPVYLNISN